MTPVEKLSDFRVEALRKFSSLRKNARVLVSERISTESVISKNLLITQEGHQMDGEHIVRNRQSASRYSCHAYNPFYSCETAFFIIIQTTIWKKIPAFHICCSSEASLKDHIRDHFRTRSEERRVGKECRSR